MQQPLEFWTLAQYILVEVCVQEGGSLEPSSASSAYDRTLPCTVGACFFLASLLAWLCLSASLTRSISSQLPTFLHTASALKQFPDILAVAFVLEGSSSGPSTFPVQISRRHHHIFLALAAWTSSGSSSARKSSCISWCWASSLHSSSLEPWCMMLEMGPYFMAWEEMMSNKKCYHRMPGHILQAWKNHYTHCIASCRFPIKATYNKYHSLLDTILNYIFDDFGPPRQHLKTKNQSKPTRSQQTCSCSLILKGRYFPEGPNNKSANLVFNRLYCLWVSFIT